MAVLSNLFGDAGTTEGTSPPAADTDDPGAAGTSPVIENPDDPGAGAGGGDPGGDAGFQTFSTSDNGGEPGANNLVGYGIDGGGTDYSLDGSGLAG